MTSQSGPAAVLTRFATAVDSAGRRPLRVLLVYCALALLAFPTLETLFLGRDAPNYALDVFDDGAVTRLGGLPGLWRDGGMSLWNPLLATGNAALAQFASTPFALDVQLARVVDPFAAYMLTLALLCVVAGAGTHLFLRRSCRVGHVAAFTGGTVATFGFWHYNLSYAAPALPLALWLGEEALRGARIRWIPLLGWISLAVFLLYNSHSQVTLLLGGVQLAYLAFIARGRRERLRRAAVWACAWVLALMAYGPVLLTQLAMLPESQRSLWARGAGPIEYGAMLRELVAQYSPFLLGIRAGGVLGGTANWYGTYFAGLVTLPAIAAAVLLARRSRPARFVLLLIMLIPIADFLAVTVVTRVQEHLGVLKSFQFSRVRLFFPFAVAASIGLGVQALQRGSLRSRAGRLLASNALWIMFGAVIAIHAILAVRGLHYYLSRHGLPHVARGDLLSQVDGVGLMLGAGLFAAGGLAWMVLSVARRRRSLLPLSAAAAGGLLLATLAERALFARVERYTDSAKLGTFEASLGLSPGLAYLRSQPNPGRHRVLSLGTWDQPNRVDHPNRLMFHGLSTADAYENIYPARYHDLFGVLTEPFLRTDSVHYAYYHTWGNRAYAFGWPVNYAIADLIGIRWVLSRGVEISAPGFVEVFARGGEHVYENRDVFARAFLTTGSRVFESTSVMLDALGRASAAELRSAAFVEGRSGPDSAPAAVPTMDEARIDEYEPDRVVIGTSSSLPATVVLTDAYVPGWNASVDGIRASVFPVDRAFRGVRVPAGRHRVEMTYRPAEARRGTWLLLLASLATAGWVLAARARSHWPRSAEAL